MEQALAWGVIILGFVLPLMHVALSPGAGAWRAPEHSRCPFGPRMGWIVMIILLGPIGWVMFIYSRRRINRADN